MRRMIGMLVLAALAAGSYALYQSTVSEAVAAETTELVRDFRRDFLAAFDEAATRQSETVEEIARRFEGIDNLRTAEEMRLRQYRNSEHVRTARRLGVDRVSGQEEIERLEAAGALVRLEDTKYYEVRDLSVSVAYVTPDAARLLERIGERFHARLREQGLPPYRFAISSVLRTRENQRALRRINPNAARGTSSHEFGTTLDIVYHRYSFRPAPDAPSAETGYPDLDERLATLRTREHEAVGLQHWHVLKGILGRVLIEMQSEGAVKVTLERQQPVFHITVADRLAGQ